MIHRLAVALAIAGLLGASAVQAHDKQRQAELIDELLRLSSENVPQRIIVKQIQAWCFRFELDGDDIVELHTLGVSDDIIEALVDTAFEELECERDDYEYVWYRAAYSPWWCVPYAWGYYWWDPWPAYYVNHHYYYPYWYYSYHHGYSYGHHDGYYGWRGGQCYVAYNPRRRATPARKRTGLTVVGGTALPVTPGSGVVARRPNAGGVVVAPGDRIETRRSPSITPRTGGAAERAQPPQRRAPQPRLTPAERVETQRGVPAQRATPPRSSAQLEPSAPQRAAEPRTLAPAPRPRRALPSPAKRLERAKSPRVAPSRPATRRDTGVQAPPRRTTPSQPNRVRRPGKKETSKYSIPPKSSGSKSTKRVSPLQSGSKRLQTRAPSSSKRSLTRSSPTRSRSSLSRPSRSSGSRSSVSRPSRSGSSSRATTRSSSRARKGR